MREWMNTVIAGLALLISLISFIGSGQTSRNAEKLALSAIEVAKKANTIAEESNKISLGIRKELPIIRLDTPNEIDLTKGLEKGNISIWNSGSVTISGFYIEVIPINGLIYNKNNPDDEPRDLSWEKHMFLFKQLLTKNGLASVDISPLIVKSIIKSNARFLSAEDIYVVNYNIVISPIEEGKNVAVNTSGYGSEDRHLVRVYVKPQIFSDISANDIIAEMEKKVRVLGGRPNV